MGIYGRHISTLYGFGKELDIPDMPESLKQPLSLEIPKDLETPEEIKVYAFLSTVEKAYINPDMTRSCQLSVSLVRHVVKTLMKKKYVRFCGLGLYALVKKGKI